jgi:hypothetical protein
LNAAADVPGTFSYSYGPTVFLGAGTHVISVTFTPADAANYTGASATRSLNVDRAPLTIARTRWPSRIGAPLPPFSVSASGLIFGDSLRVVDGCSDLCDAGDRRQARRNLSGDTVKACSSPNYAITFVAGTAHRRARRRRRRRSPRRRTRPGLNHPSRSRRRCR